jgi:hypothetical protein
MPSRERILDAFRSVSLGVNVIRTRSSVDPGQRTRILVPTMVPRWVADPGTWARRSRACRSGWLPPSACSKWNRSIRRRMRRPSDAEHRIKNPRTLSCLDLPRPAAARPPPVEVSHASTSDGAWLHGGCGRGPRARCRGMAAATWGSRTHKDCAGSHRASDKPGYVTESLARDSMSSTSSSGFVIIG